MGKGPKATLPGRRKHIPSTLPETNIAYEYPIFLGKYHQNGGFSMAQEGNWKRKVIALMLHSGVSMEVSKYGLFITYLGDVSNLLI